MRRSATSITVEQIEALMPYEPGLRDHFQDGTQLVVKHYLAGYVGAKSWYRVAVLNSEGQCVEKYSCRTASGARRKVVTITRAHGGPR